MAGGGFFRGTSIDQDSRYFNQDKKLLAKMAFPASFESRVDLSKVQREVINQWVAERLTQLLGFEDDIVVAMVINLLEPKVDERLDPRQLQVALTGFLAKDAAAFTQELWELLLSAQASPTGIPAAILDKKKRELERAATDKAQLRQVLDAKRADADASRRERAPPPDERKQSAPPSRVEREPEPQPRGRRDATVAEAVADSLTSLPRPLAPAALSTPVASPESPRQVIAPLALALALSLASPSALALAFEARPQQVGVPVAGPLEAVAAAPPRARSPPQTRETPPLPLPLPFGVFSFFVIFFVFVFVGGVVTVVKKSVASSPAPAQSVEKRLEPQIGGQ